MLRIHARRFCELAALASMCAVAPLYASPPSQLTDAAQAEQEAFAHYYGWKVRVDRATSARLFERAASDGRPVSQWMLARQYLYGNGVQRNEARAFTLAQSAALQGLPSAQSMVGAMYLEGIGVGRDTSQAVRWLFAAAEQGEASAFRILATLYAQGTGVAADAEFAHRLLLRSAELGDLRGLYRASMALLDGPPRRRNIDLGLRYLRRSAVSRHPASAYTLGWLYLSGFHVSRDPVEAVRWIRQAAGDGSPHALFWLSQLTAKGLGVAQDVNRANSQLSKALAIATASDKNSFSWELSVNPDPVLRDGALAVRVMQTLAASDAADPRYIDTLAAALAEAGDCEKAVSAQLRALSEARKMSGLAGDFRGMEERLELYRAGKPYREVRRQ
jgi:TPR repeat protein